MFKPVAAAVILGCLLAGCGRQTQTASDATYQSSLDAYLRQLEEQERINELTEKLLEQQEKDFARTSKLIEEQEAQGERNNKLLEKMEEQARRYDAILDAQERQLGIKK
jgi:hypothetical protein